jgi:pyruvate dehydrogenase E1 component beta subunit
LLIVIQLDAENGFMGMGVGAAMTGLRPIVEGMNMGFLLLAFNQISNNCGMLHYTSGGQFKVPMVIRGPGGVGRQLGAEHSQRLESYFQSIPGVQLVACSTVANAKALFKSVSTRAGLAQPQLGLNDLQLIHHAGHFEDKQ